MKFPVNQPYVITTHFDPVNHPGIDIAPTPGGTTNRPCYSPEDSTVYVSGYRVTPEGHYIILKGSSGVYYYFGHFSERKVSTGQSVSEGQVIGIIGMTGAATGIHTHHEVRPGAPGPGHSIDPEEYYNNQGGPVNPLNKGDIINLWRIKLPGKTPPQSYIDAWMGKDMKDLFYDLSKNVPEWYKAGSSPAPVTKETALQYLETHLT